MLIEAKLHLVSFVRRNKHGLLFLFSKQAALRTESYHYTNFVIAIMTTCGGTSDGKVGIKLQWLLCNINTLRPRQDGRHFPDNILKCIFLNENVWILIEISLKFVPKGPIDNIPALV